jgi:hypothetical protein
VCPINLTDKIITQVENEKLDVIAFNVITPRNSLNFVNNLIGLYEHNLLETTNIMDVEPINHGKPGEWIGFGSGPTTVPSKEDNRLHNLVWVIYNTQKPFCLQSSLLERDVHRVRLLRPSDESSSNKKIKSDKFTIACLSDEKFKILRINGNDIIH